MGVLSALPLISVGNCFCCLWVISGGVVAAYVLQDAYDAPITPGDGAIAGLLAGLAGAVVHFILSIPIDILMAPVERNLGQRVIEMLGTVPPEVREMVDRMRDQQMRGGVAAIIARRIFLLVFMRCVAAVFSTIGGVVGAAIFGKKRPKTEALDVPPPA